MVGSVVDCVFFVFFFFVNIVLVMETRRVCVWWCIVVCFQAEDGIRDLVRSRGLGDVYKRQYLCNQAFLDLLPELNESVGTLTQRYRGQKLSLIFADIEQRLKHNPVSYTHLTLPTSDLV